MANNSIFSGSSRYATDFGQLIDRAVRIASLPLEQIKSGQNRIKDQSTAMSALTIKMGSLRSAITSVNDARDALSVNVSNGMVASASAGEEALPGTYKLQVITTGSSSFSFSNEGLTKVTNPNTGNISSSESFTLTVGTSEFDLDLGDKSLSGLAAAINESDAPVEAVLVNVGTSADP
ncbi:MAG TPA: flagellar cap protein FliD N-terminal domain-containing protein, partial [Bryobacteraceae bacterium]|nr:flagellar cap protein FliD N-terminal domain-containing protein [Bryobacteraceae bacterium]